MCTFLNVFILNYKVITTKTGQEVTFCEARADGQFLELIVFPNMNKEMHSILSRDYQTIPITVYGEEHIQDDHIQILVECIGTST